jgi:hypothetical protein
MSNLPVPRPAGSVPACSCATGAAQPPSAGGEPADSGGRFGPTHALILLIAVLGLGSALFLVGAPLQPSSRCWAAAGRSARPP